MAKKQRRPAGGEAATTSSPSNESMGIKGKSLETEKNGGGGTAVTSRKTPVARPYGQSPIRKDRSVASPYAFVLIALLSLLAGIFTPPFISYWIRTTGQRNNFDTPSEISQEKEILADKARQLDETTSVKHDVNESPFPTECSEENLSNFLHESQVRGLHVVCVASPQNDEDSVGSISVRFFPGAARTSLSETPILVKGQDEGTDASWIDLRRALERELQLPPPGPQQQPWAIFTPKGERIIGAHDKKSPMEEDQVLRNLIKSQMLVITEGGTWIWPGVRVGFERPVELYSIMPGPPGTTAPPGSTNRTVIIETLSLTPLVVSVKGFLSEEECDHIQQKASPRMRYSEVTLMDRDKGKPSSDWRTSQTAFLVANDRILHDLDRRTASLTRIPKTHQENLQVLRYEHSEKYSAHHDYFDPDAYRSDSETLRLIENGRSNRFATVFWYLSDVEDGGETVFPRWNGAPQPVDFNDCTKGLKVKPERGKVIIFYSLTADGKMDPLSLHGACPVKEGIKWAANKWVWNSPKGYTPM